MENFVYKQQHKCGSKSNYLFSYYNRWFGTKLPLEFFKSGSDHTNVLD